jgi:hypothetical protein
LHFTISVESQLLQEIVGKYIDHESEKSSFQNKWPVILETGNRKWLAAKTGVVRRKECENQIRHCRKLNNRRSK